MQAEQKSATRKFELEENLTTNEIDSYVDKMVRTQTSLRNMQNLLNVVSLRKPNLSKLNAAEIKEALYEFYMFTMGDDTIDALSETVGQSIDDLDNAVYLLETVESSIEDFNEVETKEEQTA